LLPKGVEDPFASWKDAQSATIQDEVFDWFTGSFVPRLLPNAPRLIIMTRYHELDLLGRILERDEVLGLGRRYLRLPMLAEGNDPIGRALGDRLWPQWFTEKQVVEARSNPQQWIGMYQQRPTAETGDLFKAEWLIPYAERPPLEEMVCYAAAAAGFGPIGRYFLAMA